MQDLKVNEKISGSLLNSPEVELRVALAEIRGQLSNTPSRFDLYGSSVAITGIFSAFFAGLVFLYLQKDQQNFEEKVISIIEEYEREQTIELEKAFQAIKEGDALKLNAPPADN